MYIKQKKFSGAKNYEKIFLTSALSALAAVCILCGCTPKPVTLWCGSPISDARFIFEYSAANSAYDGFSRTFSVKDEEKFVGYITSLDEYYGTMQLADDNDKQAYCFYSDGEVFVCYAKDSDGNYAMHASCYCIDGYYFYYPHAQTYWDYNFSLDYGGTNYYATTTTQNWEYFKNFYSKIDCAVIYDDAKTVTFQNVTLTVGDGEVYWTIDFGEQ